LTHSRLTDAEHAFSKGHHKVNFMQHNMSSQTFKAEVAIGSWDGYPVDVQHIISVIDRKMVSGTTSNDDLDSSDTDTIS